MTCGPKHDHAFEQSRAGARHAGKEIHVCARDEAGSLIVQRDAVFHGCILEEAHFSPDVVDCGYEEV